MEAFVLRVSWTALGRLLGGSWDGSWEALGKLLEASKRHLGPKTVIAIIFSRFLKNIGNLGDPSWGRFNIKYRIFEGSKRVSKRNQILKAFWHRFGDDFRTIFGRKFHAFWGHFGSFLGVWRDACKNIRKSCEKSASWSPSWRQDWPSWSQDGAKLPNLAPRWAQDGHLRAQDGQLETILGGICRLFGILVAKGQIAKNLKKLLFL